MAQYDTLAQQLGDIEAAIQFYRDNVEFPSFFRALGPVEGKRVLDVGCGDGIYARLVAERGATHVVGTDSSSEMIRLAVQAEAERPLGVTYQVHDVATMPALGEFDLVVAVNVLHYADNRATLEHMCERIAANLAPGGRLLTYVGNADVDTDAARDFGFHVHRPADLREGDSFTVTIATTPPASVEVRYWPMDSLIQAMGAAGLNRIEREPMDHNPITDDDVATRLGRLLKNPPGFLLSAYKD
jgi:toxoflavin synthase